ncbi:hypothetical protein CVT24_005129 [Panaeolus cyanescens]|uniref:SEC7 domain-containing protein n=1 Tax=Panaeolus cyanescens TaxID=181874 RepID=A0A409V9Q1_9AGAR|nr:hypothetical protein CVT24_005129 [Panaeolus cyanescens]
MTDHDNPSSRAEKRMAAVAMLKRAASLPRMKDGRRPPMHVEAMSEGEKAQSEEERAQSEEPEPKSEEEHTLDENDTIKVNVEPTTFISSFVNEPPDGDDDPDTETDERPTSPATVAKKRRSRSRSRSRGSKDFKAKLRLPQSPVPQLAGDSSQDEMPTVSPGIALPKVPPLVSPIPSPFPFLQQSAFLRSPTPLGPDMGMMYPGTSPPTPLPTLEDIQRGLMRSNSAGSSAVNRKLAMHKLTGGTDTYDASPSPTPPPLPGKLGRNNTVSGGERIAARQNMLNRIGTRIIKEADAGSGAEDRGAPSPTPKRRRRRSRRGSAAANPSAITSDSDFASRPNTPGVPQVHTPLPLLQDQYTALRTYNLTPGPQFGSSNASTEQLSGSQPNVPSSESPHDEEPELVASTRRRSVVIEDQDDEERFPPPQRQAMPMPQPGTPRRLLLNDEHLRQHTPDLIYDNSINGGALQGRSSPAIFHPRAPSRNEFSGRTASPFTQNFAPPLTEKTLSDEDEEQVLYPATTARPRTPYGSNVLDERVLSWDATLVPEIRMHVHNEDVDEDDEDGNAENDDQDEERQVVVLDAEEEPPNSAASSNSFLPDAYTDQSPRGSISSKSILVESEQSPNPAHPYNAISVSEVALVSQLNNSNAQVSDGSVSPQFYPTRLSVASRIHSSGDRSPLNVDFPEYDDRYLPSGTSKKMEGPTTWEKVISTLTRSGSTSGRRSRTNSIAARERRDNTDSSVSRESGASLNSSKTDKGDAINAQATPMMQTPSASASMLSLPPHSAPRGNVSPIPPASSADMSKYSSSKLFPFPGMLLLEEERRLAKSSSSASTPDASFHSREEGYSQSSIPNIHTPEREPHLIHQHSDLFSKYPDSVNASPSSPNFQEYIDVSPASKNASSYNLKLPTTLPGVKQWLSKNSRKKGPASLGGPSSFTPIPPMEFQNSANSNKKPSLSDIFGRKDSDTENISEDVQHNASNNRPTATRAGSSFAIAHAASQDSETGRSINALPDMGSRFGGAYRFPADHSANRALATPDPSSISEYPAPTPSESSSTSSSHSSQGALILERLEESLIKGQRNDILATLEDPPRKVILASPVLQVVNSNTVKDRFLILFNDILIVAKPAQNDRDNLMDAHKPSLPDRKYSVKHVVLLRDLRFCPDRSDVSNKSLGSGARTPLMRTFISQFAEDPERAISNLFSKSRVPEDSALLGQLLFKAYELDRTRLGEFLAKRTSKAVLKSYLDSFGFMGLSLDVALRIFLQSVNVSPHLQAYGGMEHLLDSFASRWYEANAKLVVYDKDMAIRLVRALVQLNKILHDGIADQPGPSDDIRHNMSSKDFQDVFKRFDPRNLLTEELLSQLYRSIRQERLCQASLFEDADAIPVTVKRALPTRLTHKTQSEPIVLRLPQADPLFTIELHGQDLVFDPPVLKFAKSSEASFRVSSTSLGPKTIAMCRCGPNAIRYSGLPLTQTIVVERPFMRNTFQIAFMAADGTKRRYMYSHEEPIVRNEWVQSLKRHIDTARTPSAGTMEARSMMMQKLGKAADAVAFKVLQETLTGSNGSARQRHQTTGSYSTQGSGGEPPVFGRSKSRSREHPPRAEFGLGHRSENSSSESNNRGGGTEETHEGAALWTQRDLEIQCQQNSTISSVLSYLLPAQSSF